MGVSRYRLCQHRKAVFTNTAGTISYCAHCRPDSGSIRRSYPNLSPEVMAFYQSRHIPFEQTPPHNPACERVFGATPAGIAIKNESIQTGSIQTGPQITSLNDGSEYFINPAQPADMELSCQALNDVQAVYWYLNDRLYRKARPTEAVFFKPRPGTLKVSCADDKGRNRDIRVLVKSE